jgi:hypothetical protein
MHIQNNDLPLIYALPKGVNFWRIDWFGELAFPNRMMRRTQPSLLLHLPQVLAENFHEDPTVLLSPNSTPPARQQRKVWVSVGTLPRLRIGRPTTNLGVFSRIKALNSKLSHQLLDEYTPIRVNCLISY